MNGRMRGTASILALLWAAVLAAGALGLFVVGRRIAQMQALQRGADQAALAGGYLVRDDSFAISPATLDGAAAQLVGGQYAGAFAVRSTRPADFDPTHALVQVTVAAPLVQAAARRFVGRAFVRQQALTLARYETITVLGPPDRLGRRTSRTIQVSCTLRPPLRPDALPTEQRDPAPISVVRRDAGSSQENALARVGSSPAVRSRGGAFNFNGDTVELSLDQCRDLDRGRIRILARLGRPQLIEPRGP